MKVLAAVVLAKTNTSANGKMIQDGCMLNGNTAKIQVICTVARGQQRF